jgi:hypothetical protein
VKIPFLEPGVHRAFAIRSVHGSKVYSLKGMSMPRGVLLGFLMVTLAAGACGKSGLDVRDAAGGEDVFTPPARCALPFDPGPCEAAIRVFAFVNGQCAEKTYGGCQGNANRFSSLAECVSVCEGR